MKWHIGRETLFWIYVWYFWTSQIKKALFGNYFRAMYRVEGQLINSGRFLGMYLFKTAKTQLIKGGGPLTSVKTINLIYFKVVHF